MTKYKIPKIEELIDAGVHFGHQLRRWHPAMAPYIYTAKKNIHIIDLEQTELLLKRAADFLYNLGKEGKKVIFVGTKKQARDTMEIEAKRAGAMYITERWLGGIITNFEVIKKNNIDKLIDLKKKMQSGDFDNYTKKERQIIDKEISRLEKFVGGITNLKGTPDALIIVDVKREKTAIREANIRHVPIIALIDTNSNPRDIPYFIPGNDDAIKSVALIIKVLTDALEEGYKEYADEMMKRANSSQASERNIKIDSAKQKEASKPVEEIKKQESKPAKAQEDIKDTEEKTPKSEKKVEKNEEKSKEDSKKSEKTKVTPKKGKTKKD